MFVLFVPNSFTSSQLACQLNWQNAAPVSQRSWVQIPYEPEIFFRSYLQLLLTTTWNYYLQLPGRLGDLLVMVWRPKGALKIFLKHSLGTTSSEEFFNSKILTTKKIFIKFLEKFCSLVTCYSQHTLVKVLLGTNPKLLWPQQH